MSKVSINTEKDLTFENNLQIDQLHIKSQTASFLHTCQRFFRLREDNDE